MGDSRAGFERFFRDEYRSVVRTLIPVVGDEQEAEAIAQEAFVSAMTRWNRIRDYDRPGAWVRRVAIRDAVRSSKRAPVPPAMKSAEEPAMSVAERVDLSAAIQTLSPQQRAAVTLHHLAGWPVAEVAEALGCAESTVRVHLHRGRQSLARVLASDLREVCDERR